MKKTLSLIILAFFLQCGKGQCQYIRFDSTVFKLLYRYKFGEFAYTGKYNFTAYDAKKRECFSIKNLEDERTGIYLST